MPNRLAASTSPYLRQHQDNPVDWYEWGTDAFDEAQRRDVPILLSVGYSACHWCHVMAHESFEDPETAAVMNDLFVNVKVDREERPDVDAIYMEAVQAMSGRGGWPMTVWMTPDGGPFYAGTYFPNQDRGGMPSFRRVMEAVADAWHNRRQEVLDQASGLTQAISRSIPRGDAPPDQDSLEAAYRQLEADHDGVHGGFRGAPKFPQQPVLEFLLRIGEEPWAPEARSMLARTLTGMARGGIYDQLGGGFARYSVDGRWLVPHFEKMLYDNAQLARIYLWAWKELDNAEYRTIAEETLDYLRRDLRHPDGGFFSAEDADSEGIEGKFYVWAHEEFMEIAGDDGEAAAAFYGVTPQGNFEGTNVLHVARTSREVAEDLRIEPETVAEAVERARRRLLEARSTRVRPGLDHKVVASWNGIAIRAFAEAGAVLDRPDLVDDARACARFVLERMRGDDGRLLRSWSEGEAKIPGFLEDHASVAVGLFTLYEVTGEPEWYRAAESITRTIPELFSDPAGGFYTTAEGDEHLLKRPKDQMDNPLPSGNSLAAEALFKLSSFTGDAQIETLAQQTVTAGALLLERYPSAVGHLAAVLHSMRSAHREVAIVGPDAMDLARVVWDRYRPHVALAVADREIHPAPVPLLEGRTGGTGTRAFVCEGFVCDLPVSTADDLTARLA